MNRLIQVFILSVLLAYCCDLAAQNTNNLSFFTPSDTLHKKRLKYAISGATATYAGFSIALYQTWYTQFPREGFHFFNDWGEWSNMDKYGHWYSAYLQSSLSYKTSKWTGLSDNTSLWIAIGASTLSQATIEVLDGFSTQWGFSWSDIGANTLGTASFALQQKYWGEQRIMFKVSSTPVRYDPILLSSTSAGVSTNLLQRTDDLFGTGFSEKILKDYNAQTLWASFNLHSLLKKQGIPPWLNIGVGYGAQNMYGGFENSWTDDDGNEYAITDPNLIRYKQYYLSPDIDFTKIKTKSPFLKTLFTFLNLFKIPAPALEYNSQGKLSWHWIHF